MATIAITGARGFVGSELARKLGKTHRVIGLSRGGGSAPSDGIAEWRKCDLFSPYDAERALESVDIAYYLVHSMLPAARLTQADFADLDVICADNFARGAQAAGIKQIVYLGGLIPEDSGALALSPHLASRKEVEQVLRARGVPVTVLRAGLVVGGNGSSFQMLFRLVRRLPLMICPRWMSQLTQPIDLRDVIEALAWCADRPEALGKTFDVGGPEAMSYLDMIRQTSEVMGRKRFFLPVPFFTTGLSKLWVTLVTGAPSALVKPLVDSLNHEMVARDKALMTMAAIEPHSFRESVTLALLESRASSRPIAFERAPRVRIAEARSVQRLPLPRGRSASWVAEEYIRWLPRAIPFVHAETDANRRVRFSLSANGPVLLELRFDRDESTSERAIFLVTGGLLVRSGGKGWLEFRQVPGKPEVLAAVHEFRPRLAWWLYLVSHARVHLWVMRRFGRHLARAQHHQHA